MIRIEHVAIWTERLEEMREFYCRHFGCRSGAKYVNSSRGFSSYFLEFSSGARLELMHRDGLEPRTAGDCVGCSHIAISLGSEQAVREYTARLRESGTAVASEPRMTGDGYLESIIIDPDGNRVELTV